VNNGNYFSSRAPKRKEGLFYRGNLLYQKKEGYASIGGATPLRKITDV
nr:hypothetical protein [Tanacetum cinerariifolium]